MTNFMKYNKQDRKPLSRFLISQYKPQNKGHGYGAALDLPEAVKMTEVRH